VDPSSNEREMFVMNGSRFGSAGYLEVLAHEFRHMIEYNHDRNDLDWEVEGSAMLAEDLLGYANDAHNRANLFIANPDQQLNRWSESNTAPRYGQGYALNRYIYDRLGTDLHREFATSDETGLNAVTEVAAAHNLGFTGLELWLDWLVALAIHDRPQTPAHYKLPAPLRTVLPERLFSYPYETETVVNQYAADYYTFLGEGEATVTFTGSTHVPLLEIQPASGERMWLAQRANYSQMQLTREFDLTAVESATLFYDVYYDIEAGYDFAYVTLSTDDGQTWASLETPHMQSKAAGDDPSDSALTNTFYTDLSGQWLTETVDLSAYAGQHIHLRFEYVTDPILNFGGLAIDNILIPEIGFVDDAETNQGWATAGFVHATAAIPQQWHLQLITFEDGVPVIREIAMNETNSIAFLLSLDNNVDEYPILVVAATAPMTLQPAHYQLNVTP
ncbi:MAG: immune inhibitor A, partial [Anaerolineales bacterium]|nr:immune inhibitor A [Anaerolineales bacterium]